MIGPTLMGPPGSLNNLMAKKDAKPTLEELHDELPDDLAVHDYVGPYQFPDNVRRRYPAAMYFVVGTLWMVAWSIGRNGTPTLTNRGFLYGGIGLVLLGAFGLLAGPKLGVRDVDALAAASEAVGFPVGHASAQLGWRGLLSRPTWRILLYSADNPPTKRGLVLIDGVDASTVSRMVEDNPEDWSQYDES